ncbi:MAG: Uma2 family endonuclease [Nitrospinae bacterium]|nr:Uma2 family endonuclease [Nitrospinota bacterium]
METPDAQHATTTKPRPAIEVAELYPPQGEWTEANYFALPDTNRLLELSKGELIMPPHPTRSHQAAVQRFFVRIDTFVQERDLGEVYITPLPVRLWPGKIREPDVLFMAREHRERMAEQAFGPPDLVMEVLSPSTRSTDRVEKFAEYAQAGIPEYWIVDHDARTAEVFVLRAGVYELLGKWGADETAHSALLESFQVHVGDLFPN